jgi:hypothetical protein
MEPKTIGEIRASTEGECKHRLSVWSRSLGLFEDEAGAAAPRLGNDCPVMQVVADPNDIFDDLNSSGRAHRGLSTTLDRRPAVIASLE